MGPNVSQILEVFDALQQLHGGKIGKSTSQAPGVGGLAGMSAMCLLAHPEVVPPELAAAALEAFYEAEDGKTRILMMIQ